MKALRYKKDSVLVLDGSIKAWVDVWIENEEIICDWNKNIFIMTDDDDVKLKKWQEKMANFENATSLARDILENAGIIYQDENEKCHRNRLSISKLNR